jgi:hypothetical protein
MYLPNDTLTEQLYLVNAVLVSRVGMLIWWTESHFDNRNDDYLHLENVPIDTQIVKDLLTEPMSS